MTEADPLHTPQEVQAEIQEEAEQIAEAKKKLIVIDGKSVFYRGYYAMPNLSTKDGTPTGGVYGFATLALEIIKRLKPDYVAVAWDKPKTNIRRRLALYPEYKAGRKPPPPDFYEQIPVLHELLQAFGWPLYELDDYEADDIMGGLAVQATKKGIETLLVTSDMDMLQLVNDHVHVFALKKGLTSIELYSPASFEAKYGIQVEQFLDLKSLKGDSSDNIPGVPGIGEKGAIQLLQEYKTLDGVYENLPLMRDSLRKKLEAGKELAYLSKQLADIWTDAPIELDLEEVDGRKINPEKIRDLLQKLEFRTLARQLPDILHVSLMDEDGDDGTGTGGLHLPTPTLTLVDTAAALAKAAADLAGKDVVLSSRIAGKHGRKPQYIFASPNPKILYAFHVPALSYADLAAVLQKVRSVIGYDIKSSLKALIELGVQDLPEVGHDVLIGAFLLNALRREQTLTELAQADLGYEGSAFEDLPDDELVQRSPEILAIIRRLYEDQTKALKAIPKLPELAAEVEWPVIPVLARMEYEGIKLNTAYLTEFAKEIDAAIQSVEALIYEHAGKEFNIGSPSQLAEILFGEDGLDLPKQGIKKGKTGYSTAASELDKLRGQHAIIDLITQYREVTKLKNTYVDTLPKQVDEHSRLHTTFSLTIAQTGRLSSNDPNLQNIPTRTELGKRVRNAFVAGETVDANGTRRKNKLISADYSQFELRLAAAMSGDKDMIKLFNSGADIHTATAAEIQGRQIEDVTKQMRSAAKTVNFGVLYGMSPHGLSAATGMSFEQSRHFIDQYFKVRGPLLAYLNGLKEFARKEGYVETLHGRRRPMPDIQSSNFMVRQSAERAAMNMPIQGTEADLMKIAMTNVEHELETRYPQAKMLLQIHDSILVECPEEQAKEVAHMLQEVMEAVYPQLEVQLTVDTKIGDNWGEL
jgi:DNA polymerase-1